MVYITAVKNACFNSKTNIYLKKYNIVCRIIQIILHEIIEEKENPDIGLMKNTVIYVLGFISQMLSGVASALLLQHFSSILTILSSIQLS